MNRHVEVDKRRHLCDFGLRGRGSAATKWTPRSNSLLVLPFVGRCRHAPTNGNSEDSAKTAEGQGSRTGRTAGVLRPRDLDDEGIPREYLRRLLDERLVERLLRLNQERAKGDHSTPAGSSGR